MWGIVTLGIWNSFWRKNSLVRSNEFLIFFTTRQCSGWMCPLRNFIRRGLRSELSHEKWPTRRYSSQSGTWVLALMESLWHRWFVNTNRHSMVCAPDLHSWESHEIWSLRLLFARACTMHPRNMPLEASRGFNPAAGLYRKQRPWEVNPLLLWQVHSNNHRLGAAVGGAPSRFYHYAVPVSVTAMYLSLGWL